MNRKERWLHEMRDDHIEGVPNSGPYAGNPAIRAEIVAALGVPMDDGQLKADWRDAINAYFERNPE